MALTARQVKAVAALLDPGNRSNEAAAAAAGVGKRTLQEWLSDDADFKTALTEAQAAMIGAATMRLTALTGMAVDALADNLDKYTPDKQKLPAAIAVLDRVLKFKELTDFEQRLAALESSREST